MKLSADLISQFVKVTNDKKEQPKDTIVYGTVLIRGDGSKWVKIDGSDLYTPFSSTADVKNDDRVTVTIRDHSAIVTGNVTSPSARTGDVSALGDIVAGKVSTETLTAELGVIRELFSSYATIEYLTANFATINNLTANYATIYNLNATNARIDTLEATSATIENLNATNARITALEAEDANIRNLFANYATIDNLNATNARITSLEAEDANIRNLFANYATIGELNALSATINRLNAGVANVNTLIFGSATGTTIQTSFSNSVVAQLGDAQIKSAMIDSLSASKITAGRISTNTVEIGSDDGSMLLSDETIQINDGSRVRVQIGKDASGDYSINIWDADGKLMFSEGGLTEDGVKDAIIRDDMVSDTANISASKLDINSLFEEINGSDRTIKSTRVYLDEEKQSLDVAFTKMTTDVEGLSNDVISHGTSIEIIQGKINSKIWQQDIDDVTGEMNTKFTSLEQSLDGFKMEVSDSYATKSDLASINLGGGNMLNGTKEFTADDSDDYWFAPNSIKNTVAGVVYRGVEAAGGIVNLAIYNDVVPSIKDNTYTFSFYACGDYDTNTWNGWHDSLEVYISGGNADIINVISSQGTDNVSMQDNGKCVVVKFDLWSYSYGGFERCWITFTIGSSASTAKSITIRMNDEDASGPLNGTVHSCMLEKSDTVSASWSGSFVESFGLVVSEKVASLQVDLDKITSRVASTESNIGTLESQITQTANSIDLAVREIIIGGTNMLKGTKTFDVSDSNIYADSVLTDEVYKGFKVRYLKNENTGYKEFVRYSQVAPAESKAQYTFSFYAKGTKVRSHLYSGGFNVAKCLTSQGVENTAGDGSVDFELSSEWERYWVTYTLEETNSQSSSDNKNALLRVWSGEEAYVCGLMLEKGNKPSDWSYHPEDANEKGASLIATVDGIYSDVYNADGHVATSIKQTADAITSRVVSVEGKYAGLILKDDAITSRVASVEGKYAELILKDDEIVGRVADAEGAISTLKLTTKSLTATIDGLELGCTNLLRNTRNPKDTSYWRLSSHLTFGVTSDSELDENVFYVSTSLSNEIVPRTDWVSVEGGETYTISAYVKTTPNVASVDFYFLSRKKTDVDDYVYIQSKSEDSGSCFNVEPGVWTKISWTFTMHSESQEGFLRVDHNGSTDGTEATLYFTKVKMEKGDRATDWSPSPEEVDERIAGASETATNYLNFTSEGLVVGNHTATTLRGNVLIDTDSVDIRNGDTVLSSFGANDIYLGNVSTSSVIHLCHDMGTITGYKNRFNEDSLKIESKNTSIVSSDRVMLEVNSTSYKGNAMLYLCDSASMGSYISASSQSYSSSDELQYAGIEICDKISLSTPGVTIDAMSGMTACSLNVRPDGVSTNGSFTANTITAKNLAWINGTKFDGKNHVLWSGAWFGYSVSDVTNSDVNKTNEITFSESVQDQPNGIVLVFSRYSSNTVQKHHLQSFFISKEFIRLSELDAANGNGWGGHTFLLTSDGTFSVLASKYLYIHNTSITGNSINYMKSKSTTLSYYKSDGATSQTVSFQNSGFVLRYVIGV